MSPQYPLSTMLALSGLSAELARAGIELTRLTRRYHDFLQGYRAAVDHCREVGQASSLASFATLAADMLVTVEQAQKDFLARCEGIATRLRSQSEAYDVRRIYNPSRMPEDVRQVFIEWATPRFQSSQLIDWQVGEYWGECVYQREVVDTYLKSTGACDLERVLICFDAPGGT